MTSSDHITRYLKPKCFQSRLTRSIRLVDHRLDYPTPRVDKPATTDTISCETTNNNELSNKQSAEQQSAVIGAPGASCCLNPCRGQYALSPRPPPSRHTARWRRCMESPPRVPETTLEAADNRGERDASFTLIKRL